MGLVLLDGCEDYSTWTTLGGGTPTIVAGRYQNCLRMSVFSNLVYRFLAVNEADTVTVGFAFKLDIVGSGFTLLTLQSDNAATDHMKVQLNTDGSFSVLRGFTVLTSTAAGVVLPNTWYYLEFQSKLHDTTGTWTLRLNGVQILGQTNVDTKNAGTKTVFDSFKILTGSPVMLLDDVYLMAVASPGTDSFLGPIAVETIYPNGNGNANAWTPVGTSPNYTNVDEVGVPNVADYTFSATVGQQDLYALTDLVHTTGTIVGVCHSAYMLETDAVTARNVKLVNRRAADTKSVSLPLTTSYRSYDYALTVDPETGAAFTIANVNALQSGVELA